MGMCPLRRKLPVMLGQLGILDECLLAFLANAIDTTPDLYKPVIVIFLQDRLCLFTRPGLSQGFWRRGAQAFQPKGDLEAVFLVGCHDLRLGASPHVEISRSACDFTEDPLAFLLAALHALRPIKRRRGKYLSDGAALLQRDKQQTALQPPD